ncbi:MAG: N-acetylmuramoyl-L-alanine amidase [Thermoanaerobaculia bacterium]|nr:N-acetylmuramoyl-L-alanine amidase [Thermoanaerobaculia bacterium]
MPGFDRTVLPSDRLSSGTSEPPAVLEVHATTIDEERIHLTREYLAIHNPPLAATLPAEESLRSISFAPRIVVVHYTAIPTLEGTLFAFAEPIIGPDREVIRRNGRLNVGIHFVVDLDGTIYRLYPETVMSRHVIGLNHVAIGIENVGDADLGSTRHGSTPLTDAQLAANVKLIRYLAAKYSTLDYVIGHSEYTDLEDPTHPAHDLFYEAREDYRTEKSDPGRRFLRRLRRALHKPDGA